MDKVICDVRQCLTQLLTGCQHGYVGEGKERMREVGKMKAGEGYIYSRPLIYMLKKTRYCGNKNSRNFRIKKYEKLHLDLNLASYSSF